MNSLVKNLLSLRCIEHLIIDRDFKIREMSLGVNRLADIPDEVKRGQDVRLGFPELVGVEEVLNGIQQGEQNNFELKGIRRCLDAASPLYIDLYITKNIKENHLSNELMILVEDATERMVLEQSLIQGANEANLLLRTLTASKQYIDKIVTSMADALVVTTPSGKIKTMNPAAQALLEDEEAELIGQPISTVIMSVDSWKSDERPSISTPLVKEVETVCQTKSGKTIPVAFSCSMVQTEIENFQGYVYIVRDMTERKQAEEAKQQFFAMISHEVRTPIASVTGMADLLLDTELTAQQREFVEIIDTSGNALLTIIDDFLNFSKIESGNLELEEQPFALQTCINEALYILSPQAKEKGLKLTLNTQTLSTMIVGDITRVRQILVNLLSNAIKFTETGSVEVSVITHKINSNSYEIQFAVKDTGIGIPRDRLERLFKAFSQVNSSITRQYGGTGLGLAICKKLSELMGGRIWVESEPGVGSTFYFTMTAGIVLETEANKECENVATNTCMSEPNLRILLVEDHLINQRIVQMMLQGMGYQADVAHNGLEALSALRRQPYDVVLMDVQMPEMDGLTVTQHICQEWTPLARPRIIALTASTMWGDRERCLASGMDDYLTKPLRREELTQVLKRCQPLKRLGEIENQEIPNPIDPAALREIQRIAQFNPAVNPKQFLLETIDYYLEEAPRLLQDMRVALSQGNLKTLQRLAHTFSSSSATLGATTLAALCAELEAMATAIALFGAAEQISKIEAEYQQVEKSLQQCQKY